MRLGLARIGSSATQSTLLPDWEGEPGLPPLNSPQARGPFGPIRYLEAYGAVQEGAEPLVESSYSPLENRNLDCSHSRRNSI